MYGRFNVTPDYAAQPYTEFASNEQVLYSLLAVTQGDIADVQIRLGDTPIENFSEATYELVPPGGAVTLFPDNVVTSPAVQGLELKRPSEGGDWQGPFVASPAGTKTTQLSVDLGFAQGIYRLNQDGKEKVAGAHFEVQAQQIDDNGNPVGGWLSVLNRTVVRDDKTPGQFTTFPLAVPEGRYQVRARSYDYDNGGGTTINAVTWAGLRAYLPSHRTYGDITLLAVRIKASNNLNNTTAGSINVTATRSFRCGMERPGARRRRPVTPHGRSPTSFATPRMGEGGLITASISPAFSAWPRFGTPAATRSTVFSIRRPACGMH